VPTSALVFALAAAFLHAFWNLVVARARDPEAATAVAFVVAVVAYAPLAAATWRFDARAWPYVAASGCLHLGYTALLAAAYRRAELSVVYPISRGTAPVLVLVVGVVALGAQTSARQALGVCAVALGVVLVGRMGRSGTTGARSGITGLAFGLAIAAFIAAYTLNDNEGVRYAAPFAYLELSMLVATLAYAGTLARMRGTAVLRAELSPATVAAGLATFASYGLVLAALQRAPAAPVAAVRETSIVIAAVFAAVVLKERVGLVRIAGAAVVVAGVALIGVS
jgi:drug/metabolite transporter (DMT)-like permease